MLHKDDDRTPDILRRLRPVLVFAMGVGLCMIVVTVVLTLTTELNSVVLTICVTVVGCSVANAFAWRHRRRSSRRTVYVT